MSYTLLSTILMKKKELLKMEMTNNEWRVTRKGKGRAGRPDRKTPRVTHCPKSVIGIVR